MIRRRIQIDYDEEHDVAYLCFADQTDRGLVKRSLTTPLYDVEGYLVIDLDDLNRIVGIEVIGALGLLLPALLLDDDDPLTDWTQPPKSIMKRIRSMAEKIAIAEFVTRAQERAAAEGRPLDLVINEDLRR